jgi:ATP-dependent exoDNAse (exonuclease V) beta subunit
LEYDTVILPETSDEIDKLHRNGTEVTYDNGKVGYFIGLGNSNSQAQGFSQYYLKDHEIDEMKMEESRILYVAMTRAINCFIWFKDINNDKVNWCSVLEEANHEN